MGKTLVFERKDYVTEHYLIKWTEEDYKKFLKQISKEAKEYEHERIVYDILKDLSFEDICDICAGRKEDIHYQINYPSIRKEDSEYNGTISFYIKKYLCEQAWDRGPYSCNCNCEDSDEYMTVNED